MSAIIRCASGSFCICSNHPPEYRNNGITPRHQCMNCRKPMCGGACGTQWMDEAERARRGYIFPITVIHPDGQEEFKQTNNEHVMICRKCGEEKKEELENSNDRDLLR